VKVILYPANLFTGRTLSRIVLNNLWFLSTHSSSSAARARYNISYTPYFTRNLKHGSNVGHDYEQPVAGRVVWSYFLRVTWINRLPERRWMVGCGSSSECGFVFQVVQQQRQHIHTGIRQEISRKTISNCYRLTCTKDIVFNEGTFKWRSHVQRMAEGRLPKIALKWISKQKRARGRREKNWMERIKVMNERNPNEGQ